MTSQPSESVVRELIAAFDITEEEARTLTAQQADNILGALQDGSRGRLTTDEVRGWLEDNGLWELPSMREKRRRAIDEIELAKTRAIVDAYNMDCLRRGCPEEM